MTMTGRKPRQVLDYVCGTYAGYWRHYRAGEPPCEGCEAAFRVYNRAHSRARTRAVARLIDRYRPVYDRLFAEELARAEEETGHG